MKYDWTKQNLLNDAKELEKLIIEESDFNKQIYLRKMYDALNYHIYTSYYSGPDINVSRKDLRNTSLFELCANVNAFARYYSLVEKFYSNLFFLNEKKYDPDSHLERCTSPYLPHEDVMTLVKEFYMSIPDDEIRNVFKSIYDKRYSSYKFGNIEEYVDNDDAYTIFVGGLNKNYMSVHNVSGARKFINTVHETGHAITNIMNPALAVYGDNYFFDEVQSYFFEILALKTFRSEKLNVKELAILLFSNLKCFFDISSMLVSQQCIAKVAAENNYKYDRNFYDLLKNDYLINKRLLSNILDVKFTGEVSYPLGFSVALKLVNIYLDNPKEGIELLKKTIMNPLKQDDIQYTLSIIDPFDGLERAGKEITLNYKKVIRRKK